jgi:hypothetical protein
MKRTLSGELSPIPGLQTTPPAAANAIPINAPSAAPILQQGDRDSAQQLNQHWPAPPAAVEALSIQGSQDSANQTMQDGDSTALYTAQSLNTINKLVLLSPDSKAHPVCPLLATNTTVQTLEINQANEETIAPLLQALHHNRGVKVLRIVKIDLNGSGNFAESLLRLFQTNTCITHCEVSFSDADLSDRNVEKIFKIPAANNTLLQFHIDFASATDDRLDIVPRDASVLADGLARNTSLKNLQLKNINWTDECVLSNFVCGLRKNTALQTLGLQYGNLPEGAGAHLATVLIKNHTLKNLNLFSTDLRRANDHTHIFQSLETNTTLEALELRGNHFVARGEEASALEQALTHLFTNNQTLKKIGFTYCKGSYALTPVAAVLAANTTLKELHLDMPFALHSDVQTIANMIANNQGLTTLGFSAHEIANAALMTFVQGLNANKSIQILHVQLICNDNIEAVLHLLNSNIRIRELQVAGVQLNADNTTRLTAAIQGNKNLFKLDVANWNTHEEVTPATQTAISKAQEIIPEAIANNRQAQATLAGKWMTGMLEHQKAGPQPIPLLPEDTTIQIAEAVARHLPLQEALKVFDALIPGEGKAASS